MAWKKHFQVIPQGRRLEAAVARAQQYEAESSLSATGSKYSSYLPEVYAGNPNRIERYSQYYNMDQDSEVNASLDTLADFCTHIPEKEKTQFALSFKRDATETEMKILTDSLQQWVSINKFKTRIWKIIRNVLMYGDQFFIRDPETHQWLWLDHAKVDKVIVDESKGKEPESYVVRDLDLNLEALVATNQLVSDQYTNFPTAYPASPSSGRAAGYNSQSSPFSPPGNRQSRFDHSQNEVAIDARHIVHLSLSEGLDANWPFGNSILEAVFKTFKQKELLEDSVIIYRVQRAPERRVFYIDVGNLPTHKAMAFVERVKNEIHQRRIPNRTGGGTSIMDASYNPLSIIEDYFFAQTAEGRGSKVETLPGGENLGEIDDLKYFNNKLIRGLRVPSSYLPTGPEDGSAVFSDGRVGTAYIQEYRFSKYCERLQMLVTEVFDREFKIFLKRKGVSIDASVFELNFHLPQNFSKFRQIEIDSSQISVFQPLAELKYFSKRFLMRRYLDLTEDEILENQLRWKEENPDAVPGEGPEGSEGLGAVGVRSEPGGTIGGEDLGDEEFGGDEELGGEEGLESPISGAEAATGGEEGGPL